MKKGLGKGLAALIGDLDEDIESQEAVSYTHLTLPTSDLV